MSSKTAFAARHTLIVVMSVVLSIAAARADSSADASITARAETALRTALGSRASDIVVDIRHGFVTLHGKVKRQRVSARAAEEVWRVQGVSGMRNLLQVVRRGDTVLMQRRDDVVKADVLRMLRADRSLDDSRITVRSVSNGVVLLSGDASSLSDDVRALRTTADRPGVRRVFSEIEATAPNRPDIVPLPAMGR